MSLWDILLVLCLIGFTKYGEYVTDECPQAGYTCPKICDVDHKHYPRKECEDASRKRNIWKKAWKATSEEEKEKIEGYRDAKTKQESKLDSTTVQSIEQLHEKAVAAD